MQKNKWLRICCLTLLIGPNGLTAWSQVLDTSGLTLLLNENNPDSQSVIVDKKIKTLKVQFPNEVKLLGINLYFGQVEQVSFNQEILDPIGKEMEITKLKDDYSIIVLLQNLKLKGAEILTVSCLISIDSTLKNKHFVLKKRITPQWDVSYGFNYIGFHDNEYYYLNEVADGAYKIVQGKDQNDFQPYSAINFILNLQPASIIGFNLNGSLHTDLNQFYTAAGIGMTIRRNINLNLGLSVYQRSGLDKDLQKGQVLSDLSRANSLVENYWTCRPFLGFSYRFASNVFAKKT